MDTQVTKPKPKQERGRDTRGRFTKGNSGRPKGSRNRRTAAIGATADEIRRKLAKDADTIVSKLMELVRQGDIAAIKICMDRLAPLPTVQFLELQEKIEELREQLEERQPGRPVATLHPLDVRRQGPAGPSETPPETPSEGS